MIDDSFTTSSSWLGSSMSGNFSPGRRLSFIASPRHRRYVALGIHSPINGEIRPGNVRGLWTGDERHQRGDLIDTPIAVKRGGGLLRRRPLARRGIQIRVDRPWLDVIDGDTPAGDFSGQPLT